MHAGGGKKKLRFSKWQQFNIGLWSRGALSPSDQVSQSSFFLEEYLNHSLRLQNHISSLSFCESGVEMRRCEQSENVRVKKEETMCAGVCVYMCVLAARRGSRVQALLFLPFSSLCTFSLVPGGKRSLLLFFCARVIFFPGLFSFISWTFSLLPLALSPFLSLSLTHAHTRCKYPSNIMSLFEEAELASIPNLPARLDPRGGEALITAEPPPRKRDGLCSQMLEHVCDWVTLLEPPLRPPLCLHHSHSHYVLHVAHAPPHAHASHVTRNVQ